MRRLRYFLLFFPYLSASCVSARHEAAVKELRQAKADLAEERSAITRLEEEVEAGRRPVKRFPVLIPPLACTELSLPAAELEAIDLKLRLSLARRRAFWIAPGTSWVTSPYVLRAEVRRNTEGCLMEVSIVEAASDRSLSLARATSACAAGPLLAAAEELGRTLQLPGRRPL